MGSKVREHGQANVSQSDEQGSKVRPEKGAQSRPPPSKETMMYVRTNRALTKVRWHCGHVSLHLLAMRTLLSGLYSYN